MTYTDAELKAAIEFAISGPPSDRTKAILHAYLETFDEERTFMEAAEKLAAYRRHIGVLSNGTWDEPFAAAYRALAAKEKK